MSTPMAMTASNGPEAVGAGTADRSDVLDPRRSPAEREVEVVEDWIWDAE